MKINQNRPDTQKVPVNTINTIMEQISDLQTDVAGLQNEVDDLGQSVSTVNIEANNADIDTINATNISSTNATINNITASDSVNTAKLDANEADIDVATIGDETVTNATITDATITNADITDVDVVNGSIQRLESSTIETGSIESDSVTANSITNNGDYTGKDITVENANVSDTVTTKDLTVTGNASLDNVTITGQVNGLSEIEADSIIIEEIKSNTAEVQSIENQKIFTSTLHPMPVSPMLESDSDRYTIELPVFTGTMTLTWKDGDAVKWTAEVIGSGQNYGITFSCTDEQVYITELFQWNDKLYIRHCANGQLLYSYKAEKELDPVFIYYNMGAWTNPKSLEELTDENTHYWVIRPSEVVMFGAVNIPRLQAESQNVPYGIKYKGDCTVNTLPSLSNTDVGDVWNITSEGYTDARFVEGAGKPINAGDDVIAVEVTTSIPGEEIITESTFDYVINDVRINEDDIYYATLHGLYKNGELVDSTPINKIFIDVNKNIWATANDQLSIGKYINGVFTETFTCTTRINDFVITSYGTAIIGTGYGGIGAGLFKSITSNTWELLSNAATSTTDCLTYYDDNHIYAGVYTGGYSDGGLEFYNGTECVLLNDQVGGDLTARPVVRSPNDIWYLCYVDQGGSNGNLYHYDGETWTGYHVWTLIVDYDESLNLENGQGLAVINNKLYASFSNEVLLVADLNEPNLEFHYVKHDIEHEDWTETVPVRISNLAYSSNRLIGWNWNNNDNPIDIYSIYATDPIPTAKVLKWDKFAAGVNYDNFTATNITASTALKSEGTLEVDGATTLNTLEVDGTSQFDDDVTVNADLNANKVITPDLEVTGAMTANSTGIALTKNVTHTGNYTQTGNQNITGNETVSGNSTLNNVTANTVIIGDLD
jgi:hypothetical protein